MLDANEGEYHIRLHDDARQAIDIEFSRSPGNRKRARVCIALRELSIEVVSYIDSRKPQSEFVSDRDAIVDLAGYHNGNLVLGAFHVDDTRRRITYWYALDCATKPPTRAQLDNCIYKGYEQIHESYNYLWNTSMGYAKEIPIQEPWEKERPSRITDERSGVRQFVSVVNEALKRSALSFSKSRLPFNPKRVVSSSVTDSPNSPKATLTILCWGFLAEYHLLTRARLSHTDLTRWYTEKNTKCVHGAFETDCDDRHVLYRAFLDVSEEQPSLARIGKFIEDVRSEIKRIALHH